MSEDNLKDQVARLIAAAPAPDAQPHKNLSVPDVSQTAIGNGNIQVVGDLKINTKEVHQTKFTPGPEHITRLQAYKLRELVHKAAKIEALSGKQSEGEGRKKWWGKLKRKFKASPYQAIPAELGDVAISWLSQEVAKLRPKLRRRAPQAWRKEHYRAIWARAKELGLNKDEVHDLATAKLGKVVSSLTKLNQRELIKLYNIIMGMPKP